MGRGGRTLSRLSGIVLGLTLLSHATTSDAAITVAYKGCYNLQNALLIDGYTSGSMTLQTCVNLCTTDVVSLTPTYDNYPADRSISCLCISKDLSAGDATSLSCGVQCVDGYPCGRVTPPTSNILYGSLYILQNSSPPAKTTSSTAQPSPSTTPSQPQTTTLSPSTASSPPSPTDPPQSSKPSDPSPTSINLSSIESINFITFTLQSPTVQSSANPLSTSSPTPSTDPKVANVDPDKLADAKARMANYYPGPNPTSTAVLSFVAISTFIFLVAMGFVTFFRVCLTCGRRISGRGNKEGKIAAPIAMYGGTGSTMSSSSVQGRSRSMSTASAWTMNSATVLTGAAADLGVGSPGSSRVLGGKGRVSMESSAGGAVVIPSSYEHPMPTIKLLAPGAGGSNGALKVIVDPDEVVPTSVVSNSILSPASPISSAVMGTGSEDYEVSGKRVRMAA
ncbi:hypothetical protein HDU97_000396 [Phlyctochytrium planicorne]|nr:hypothetical protein HDU97_000396 [Phlyctochytrium planicorne]